MSLLQPALLLQRPVFRGASTRLEQFAAVVCACFLGAAAPSPGPPPSSRSGVRRIDTLGAL
eukprot:3206764-Alexandrium_andersonii.AAC.1